MKYLAVTGALFIALIVALFALPLLNTVVDFETVSALAEGVSDTGSADLVSSVDASVQTDSSAAQVIPVTDLQEAVVIPVIDVAEASENAVDFSADDAAFEAAALANAEAATEMAVFDDFVASVINGNRGLVSGIYVQDALAIPILQQPSGNPGHITMQAGAATQFGMASDYGAIGIIAHNFLVGNQFFELQAGMEVYVVFGDGSYDVYLITEIRRFQALSPNSPYSNFLDLDNDNELLTGTQLFNQIYNQPGNLIFQTCIDNNGLSTWGRIFISAEQIGTSS